MSPVDSGSEGESGEKPIRERLKQTTIDKTGQEEEAESRIQDGQMEIPSDGASDGATGKENEVINGIPASRPTRKRSFEYMGKVDAAITETQAQDDSTSAHVRKRTREVTESEALAKERGDGDDTSKTKEANSAGDKAATRASTPGEQTTLPAASNRSDLTSPRRKRSRESLDPSEGEREQKVLSTEETKARRSSSEERRKDTNSSESDATSSKATMQQLDTNKKAPVFGEILKPAPIEKKADPPQTSPSAFAASGFASMAGTASAFGASSSSSFTSKPSLSQSTTASPFASPGKQTGAFGSSFAAPSWSFASAGGTPAFGGSLGTSSFGSGFGGGFGAGAKLNSFAAPTKDANLAAKPKEKAFGATEDEEDGSEATSEAGDEPESEAATPKDDEERPSKFQMKDVHTGEDNDDTMFSERGKLFQFHNDQNAWKERGVGAFKVNLQRPDNSEPSEINGEAETQNEQESEPASKIKARFVMRNHATHKVILNTPIFKEMSVKEQSGKQLLFICRSESGEMTTYTIRMSKEEYIQQLLGTVQELQGKM